QISHFIFQFSRLAAATLTQFAARSYLARTILRAVVPAHGCAPRSFHAMRWVTSVLGLIVSLMIAPVYAAVPLNKIVMTSGSASERDGVIYVAQDLGLFRKYGLDLSFVQVRNGPVAMSAFSSGETQFHWGSVSGANLGAIAEGADLVFVAGFINRLSGMFVVNAKIKTPMELKGKSIGVNSLSGGGWIFSMLMLDYWGLVPERDKIQFRTLGDQAVMAQGVLNGTVDAAFLGYT